MTAALLCHTPEDDESEGGAITRFGAALEERCRFVTGRPELEIVTDRTWASWHAHWRRELDGAPDECALLIAVLTPRWLADTRCRQELERFRRREQAEGRVDLVLGVEWYPADQVEGAGGVGIGDELAADLARRPLVAWHDLRHQPDTSPAVQTRLDELAERVRAVVGPEPPVRTLTVDPSGLQGDHTTISAAIAAAGRGDRIVVRPGAYDEGLRLDRPVQIVGDGPVQDIVVQARGCDAVLLTAPVARVVNLTLHQAGGGDWYGIDTGIGRLAVEDCVVTSDSLAAVSIRSGADPTLRRNWISSGSAGGILVHTDGLGIVEDNEITGSLLAGIEITTGGDPVVRRNRITANALGGIYVHDGGLGTIEDNDIADNDDAGVDVEAGAHPLVRNNRITGNRRSGIYVHDDGRATHYGNTFARNRPRDVEISDDAGPVYES